MKKRDVSVGLAIALVGYAAAASAAEPSAILKQVQGRVFVSQATAMGAARDGMPLYAGNRLVVIAGGAARVVYANGCVVEMPENSMLAMGGADQCSAGQALVRTTEGFQKKAIGQTLNAAVQTLVTQFGTYSPTGLAAAYGKLDPDLKAQLLTPGVLTQDQLAALYVSLSLVSQPESAAFMTLLTTVQGDAAAGGVAGATAAALGAAGGAGGPAAAAAMMLGGLAFTGAQVAVAVGAIGLIVGIILANDGGGTSFPSALPLPNPVASP